MKMDSKIDSDTDWLRDLLNSVQLERFYEPIKDHLQITRLAHFDYVHTEDLEKIGISKPGVRRLLDAVRKRKIRLWKKKFKDFFGPTSSNKDKEASKEGEKLKQLEPGSACIILEKDLKICEELGNGSFGVVHRAIWSTEEAIELYAPDSVYEDNEPLKPGCIPVAVKVLKADAFSQPGVYDDFRREVEAMHSLKHPHLIHLYGVCFHPLMMVVELCPVGSLLDYIRNQDGKVPLYRMSKWANQVACGMAYLEENRFLHRDLACRNILLITKEHVKIGDFGLMRALSKADNCYVMSERRRVPFPWCAPESLRQRQFSHASDVWMFAVVLWEIYSFGEEPWIGLNGSDILRLIMREGQRLKAPFACSPDMYTLMMKCWELSPRDRPTFADILQILKKTNTLVSTLWMHSHHVPGQLHIDNGDPVTYIDMRPELDLWKGQNQRTLEIGLFSKTSALSAVSHPLVAVKCGLKVPDARPSLLRRLFLDNSGKNDDYLPSKTSKSVPKLAEDPVALTSRKTIESVQPTTTRAGNSSSKNVNYIKLTNERRPHAPKSNAKSESIREVKEALLIDLDLPPATRPVIRGTSSLYEALLDQPIDVPENGDYQSCLSWSTMSSLSNSLNVQDMHLAGARSLDGKFTPDDPFDTSIWLVESQNTTRPNYNEQVKSPQTNDIQNYSQNNESLELSNKIYSRPPSTIPSNIALGFSAMSLEDRLSPPIYRRRASVYAETTEQQFPHTSANSHKHAENNLNDPEKERQFQKLNNSELLDNSNNDAAEKCQAANQYLDASRYGSQGGTPTVNNVPYRMGGLSQATSASEGFSDPNGPCYRHRGPLYANQEHYGNYDQYFRNLEQPYANQGNPANQTYESQQHLYATQGCMYGGQGQVYGNQEQLYGNQGQLYGHQAQLHGNQGQVATDQSRYAYFYDEVHEPPTPKPHRPAPPLPSNK